MSFSFSPNASAISIQPWNITLLSQRDVSNDIPINYVTRTGVSLTTACFAHNRFEESAAAKCISNLLSAGFGTFVVDLYWDSSRRIWSFCPIELPAPGYTGGPLTISSSSPYTSNRTTATQLVTRAVSETSTSIAELKTDAAYMTKANAVLSASSSSPQPTTLSISTTTDDGTAYLAIPTPEPGTGQVLYQAGSYTCSRNMNLPVLTSVLADFLLTTDNTLQAILYYFTFNFHLAASLQDPDTLPSSVDRGSLPNPTEALSSIFNQNFSMYTYTPTLLAQQRTNLNMSWFSTTRALEPDPLYLNLQSLANGDFATEDSWPSETFLQVAGRRRLLLGSGTVDAAMRGYNFSTDSSTIFQDNPFVDTRHVAFSDTGILTSGCLFRSSDTSLNLNASWALSSDLPPLEASALGAPNYNTSITSLTNLTSCGLSPLLNQTLLNTTADIDILPYQAFLHSTVWSWSFGEPRSTSDDDLRCAVVDASSASNTQGRWRVEDCTADRHAACRSNTSPLNWTISPRQDSYRSVHETCPPGFAFSVPRTALENSHLLSSLHSSSLFPATPQIYINLNSLNTANCWVVGADTPCPYAATTESSTRITVPVVAGVIVLTLAALTLLVKCAGNRRSNRRRRGRGEGKEGWDYEGVPA